MSVVRTPGLARRLLASALPEDARDYVTNELDEVFHQRHAAGGALHARAWYWREALSFSMRFAIERIHEHAAPDGGLALNGTSLPGMPPPPRRGFMQRTLESWTRDFTYAIRRLLRAPGFAFVTVLTLALAIGANTAIFSVVDAVLIHPLSFPNADRLVVIRGIAPGTDLPGEFPLSPEFYVSYRDQADKLENIGMFQLMQTTVRTPDQVDRLFAAQMTSSLFATLGVQPAIGRLPTKEDDAAGAQVALISDSVWRNWFKSSPDVIGKTIEVSNTMRTVIGVMRPDFRFPDANFSVWLRAGIADETKIVPGRLQFQFLARMKPGVRPDEVAAQLAPIAKRLPERWAGNGPRYLQLIEHHRPVVRPLRDQVVGEVARPLWILLGTVGIVLLIACANVANLFIVRAQSQRRAMAVRQALGAGRAALVRSMMSEAIVLAALGGIGGVLIAWAGVPMLIRAAPEGIPNLDGVHLSGTALLFTAGISLLAACAFGLLPAVRLSSPAMVDDLRQGSRSVTSEGRFSRNTLVVVQTASALVLLVAAGLLGRSFLAMSRVDPGFETQNIFTFQMAAQRPQQLVDGPTWSAFHEEAMRRLGAIPGVQSVGFVNELPFDEGAAVGRFITERPGESVMNAHRMSYTYTGGQYFQTMAIPLVKGRLFEASDRALGSANVLVSRAAAQALWPEEDAVGKRLKNADPQVPTWHTVVGVVGDVRLQNFRQQTPDPLIYFPPVGPEPRSWAVGTPAYVVRSTRMDTITAEVRAVLREYVPEAPMYRVFTMTQLADRAMAQLHFTMLLLAIAAGLAVVLGAVGIYGVLSYVVSRRTREIAVRMALGAKASAVRRMVVIQGARVTLIGVALGIVVALAATRVLDTLLFGVKAFDAPTFVAMAALMVLIALLASYLPARRASSVDPLQSLTIE